MNRSDIQQLQSIHDYPALSILLPTHRNHPENRQDAIRLRNLINQAAERLRAEFPSQDIAPIVERLNSLATQVDYRHLLDGLSLFVSRHFSGQFYLPFPVKERVVVDKAFATRDLVYALNRSPRYRVLVLSEKPTRLYEAVRDTLAEMETGGFPMMYTGPGAGEPLPGGFGIRRSAHRDEHMRRFFRQVDNALGEIMAAESVPLIVVGVERYLAFFDEVSKGKRPVLARLTGSHDKTPAAKLAQLVWPLAQAALADQRQAALRELGTQPYVSGIDEVWRKAQTGRGKLLFVEEGYRYPAHFDAEADRLLPSNNGAADAVDELIEMVLNKGGQVIFVEDGALNAHQRIALMLRY